MSKSDEKNRLKQMGVTLFYHQIKATDKIISSVEEYSPARQFFSSIIESLGRVSSFHSFNTTSSFNVISICM